MDYLAHNLKYLRKTKGLTQEELALKVGVNRAMIGSYEENRAVPKLSVLQDFSYFFSISIDSLINSKLWELTDSELNNQLLHDNGDKLRILSTVVDKENKELITTVPIQASAGYTNGYADPEYIEELPHFSLPLNELSKEKTYRVFQIKGDSMNPIQSGSYIICEYIVNWDDVADGKPYIIITKDDGIVYKRIFNKLNDTGEFVLKSDNPEYEPYNLHLDHVLEIWKALGYISFTLPEPDEINVQKLHKMVLDLQNEVKTIKKDV